MSFSSVSHKTHRHSERSEESLREAHPPKADWSYPNSGAGSAVECFAQGFLASSK